MQSFTLKEAFSALVPASLRSTKQGRPGSAQQTDLGRVPLVAEALEPRRLLSISVTNDTSGDIYLLIVTGDGNNNNLTVYAQDYTPTDKISVYDGTTRYGPYLVTDVNKIIIDGAGGNDTLTIETDAENPQGDFGLDVPADMYGGTGNDTLIGGDFADRMYGGDGGDYLDGRSSADNMYGGAGADTFEDVDTTGGDGMWGEAGNDSFNSGDGAADYLDGGADTDTLLGYDPFGVDSILNIP